MQSKSPSLALGASLNRLIFVCFLYTSVEKLTA